MQTNIALALTVGSNFHYLSVVANATAATASVPQMPKGKATQMTTNVSANVPATNAYPTVGRGTVRQASKSGKITFGVILATTKPEKVTSFAFVDTDSATVIYVGTSAKGLKSRLQSLEAHPTVNANLHRKLLPYVGKSVTVLDCTSAGLPTDGTRMALVSALGSVGNQQPVAPVALDATDHTDGQPADLSQEDAADAIANMTASANGQPDASDDDDTDAGDLPAGTVDAAGMVTASATDGQPVAVAKSGKRKAVANA